MKQKHIKYIELLTKEYLKRSDSFDPQTIRRQMNEGSISVHVSEALAAMAELQKEMLPYLSHLPSCNLNNQLAWFEAEQALADTPEKYRDADYHTEIEEMNHKKKQCTCGLNELLTPKP